MIILEKINYFSVELQNANRRKKQRSEWQISDSSVEIEL
jgi:hypothetical protein